MSSAVKCLIVLAIVALLFITELIPLAITAMGGAIACGLLGFIPAQQVFSGLSDSTVVLFAGMFVVGAALFHTGLAQKIGIGIVKISGTKESSLMFGIMVVSAALSSCLSNTGTAACLMPVVLGICAAAKIPASRQLMPLAYAAGIGGVITMVGTPPNIIVSGVLTSFGYESFSFFEFAWIGIPLTFVVIAYMMFIGKYLLPKAELDADQEIEQEIEATVTDSKKQIVSGLILAVCIIVMALDLKAISLEMTAIVGALVCVLTGCLTEKQAYSAIDKTGAGKLIAEWAVSLMGGSPTPIIMTSVLFIISCTLTQFMSNTAACALLAPVGVAISQQLGASPKAVLMAIGVAASCAFATPVGTPPCTLVLGPGGYKFMDYVKVGVPLVVLCFIVSIIVIPMVWPFFPG